MSKQSVSYFLVKSEPYKYAWDDFVRDGSTRWDGVRNFEARNHLRAMKVGDLVLYYHSNDGKEIVGVARCRAVAYPDPTAKDDAENADWSAVDLEPYFALKQPVSLATIKSTPALETMQLVKRSRLSVTPVTPTEFRAVLTLGKTKLPSGGVD